MKKRAKATKKGDSREISEEEEAILVSKAIKVEMAKIMSGEIKTKPYSEIRKKYGIK